MVTQVRVFGRVSGLSRVGDLLRQYAFSWLAFYLAAGSAADKVFFLTIVSLVQAVPSLIFSHYAARFVRHFSAHSVSLWSNAGMGGLSLATGLAVLGGLQSPMIVALVWGLIGLMEVLYYPARDCLYADLAHENDAERARANRSAASIYHVGRAIMSLAMLFTVWLLGPIGDEVPRAAIAAALLIDAATFAVVVGFLVWIPRPIRVRSADTEVTQPRLALSEAAQVPGAIPVLICILMLWSFAYSSFYFAFGFYSDFVGVGEWERQMTFYTAMFASACGGFYGARTWQLTFRQLVLGMAAVCVVEGVFSFVPTNFLWGTIWIALNSALSIMVYTAVFDGIIPQLVQGLGRNAEVSATINLVKEGLSPILTIAITFVASTLNAPRMVLLGACSIALAVVVVTTLVYRRSIVSIIRASTRQQGMKALGEPAPHQA